MGCWEALQLQLSAVQHKDYVTLYQCDSAAAERSGPGALTHLTNSMFLQTMAGAKTLLGAAAWATCTLLGSRADSRFPLTIRLHSGEQLMLPVVRPLCRAL